MLHLHFANRYETLIRLLLGTLGRERGSVFAADQLIVPSAAVRRSLTLAIAEHDGICANVRFDFLARWLWQQIGRLVPSVGAESPFAPPVLAWRVYTALGETAFVAAHPRLASYLRGADAVMRFELAQRIAGLLEQYVTYRPDWLEAWLQGRPALPANTDDAARADERWQAALWRRIGVELGMDALHPANAFSEALQRGGAAAAARAGLPSCAHVFALPTMPPLHLQLLQQLGRAIDLHVYVLNPCREYWFELIDRRRLSHLAAHGRAEGHEEGNRLLAAWGRQTQSHVGLLVDVCGDSAVDDGHFEPHPGDTLLARLHNALLDLTELEPGSVTLREDDRSIEVHRCHSLTRELEVLQDHLLGLFAKAAASGDPLRPSDILVVTPDLDAAAPLIDALFGTAPRERFIPYTVSGRSRSRANAPARALLALLALAGSRFPASAVFGLLQQAIVARRFGLDNAALEQVHEALRQSGMRWALDAEHRASFDVPAQARHTLAEGLERLFLGYASPDRTAEPFGDLLPAGDTEGSDAWVLGAFWRFANALQHLQAAASAPQRPEDWVTLLLGAMTRFLDASDDELDDLRELHLGVRELADTMQRGGITQPVPLAVVRAALEQLLDDPARGGVPTGSVTFSSMSSLRNLPFAVVCAVGLDDGAFPTASRPPEFDLMALQPRRGDRQRRDDERNLFLDLLLAARSSLYLSHTGRSVRDNAPLPPSVLLSELLDLLLPAIADDTTSAEALARARQRLVVEHPLQPFSSEGFAIDGDPRLRSFNQELAGALRRSLQVPAPPAATPPVDHVEDDGDGEETAAEPEDEEVADPLPPFFGAPLAAPSVEWQDVSLAQVSEFFRNPCRYLLRRRLGIELQHDAAALQDDEPFVADWQGRNALAGRLLPPLLQGVDSAKLHRLARAGTEMPSGALGAQQLTQALVALERFSAQVREATAAPCLPPHQALVECDLDGERWRLRAGFADLRPGGLVRWRYDETRARDYLDAWLQQLAFCADPPASAAPRTLWLSADGRFEIAPVAVEDARTLLCGLLRLYRRGLCEPLHFYPKSAWAYLRAGGHRGKAAAAWRSTPSHPHGEDTDPAYRLALRGCEQPLDDDFEASARSVFGPLLARLEDPRL